MRRILIAAMAAVAVSSCRMESDDPYTRKLEAERYTKDSLLRSDLNSPITNADRRHFLSLAYFDTDKKYVVKGRFEKLDTPATVAMKFSLGNDQEFFYVGDLYFDLFGHQSKLKVYQTSEQKKDTEIADVLFVPFWDSTNGNETFEGGRYLYIKDKGGKKDVEVDFNRAANPNCAYNPGDNCPIPPEENRLNYRIEAGEKKY